MKSLVVVLIFLAQGGVLLGGVALLEDMCHCGGGFAGLLICSGSNNCGRELPPSYVRMPVLGLGI